jgi:hypothetical protein
MSRSVAMAAPSLSLSIFMPSGRQQERERGDVLAPRAKVAGQTVARQIDALSACADEQQVEPRL